MAQTSVVDPPLSTPGTTPPPSSPARRRRRRRSPLRTAVVVLVLAAALLFTLFPVYYVVVAAFDATNALGSLWPTAVTGQNFLTLVSDPVFPYFRWLWNSIKVSVGVSAVTVVLTTMAAFAFSRYRFTGRRPLMKAIVIVQLFPNILALIAIYLIVQQVGRNVPLLGLNSDFALAVVYLGGVLGGNVWLMQGYLNSIPRELDESALIDGASMTTVFFRILLPLAKPMLAVVAVLSFVGTYGEVLLARVLLTDSAKLTLPVGMWTYVAGQYNERWGPFAAGALIAAVPAMILMYLLQDWLVKGLTQGAVKS